MGLSADIQKLRDVVLEDLSRAYKYYSNTRHAWWIVRQHVESGGTISIRDPATGDITTEKELLPLSREYVRGSLVSATFQDFLSLFEDFIFGLIGIWLPRYPHMIGKKQVNALDIFSADDLEAVKRKLILQVVGELRYQKVSDWFIFLDRMVTLGCPTPDEIGRIAEAKVSRDVLVHNRGIVNAIYEDKAGMWKRFSAGQQLEISEDYHLAIWELLRKVVKDVADAATAKASD